MRIPLLASASSGFWDTIRNIGWVSAGRVIRMGGGLVVGTLVVRYLGPTQYGTFSYAFAIYGLFNMVSSLGLDVLVVSEIAVLSQTESELEILGTAFWLKSMASVVTTIAAVTFVWVTHPKDITSILIVAMLSVAAVSQGLDVVDYFFQARVKSRLTIIPQLGVFVTISIARICAVLFKASLLMFGVIASMEIFLTELVLAAVYYFHQRNLFQWKFRKEKSIRLLKASWPLLISSLLITIYMRTDQIILGNLSTKAAVGMYASACKLSEIWYAIPTLICSSVMPKILRGKTDAPEVYYSRLQRLYDLLIAVSIPLALATVFFGKYAIRLLFGAAYLPAVSILDVHIWTGPFVFIGVASSIQLVHEDKTKISLQRSLIGALTNIALNYLLVPRFGGVGSAVGTLVTQALTSYVLDAFNKGTRHIFIMKTRALCGLWLFSLLRKKSQAAAV